MSNRNIDLVEVGGSEAVVHRRRWPRFDLSRGRQRVSVNVSKHTLFSSLFKRQVSVRLEEISQGGCRIRSKANFEKDEMIRLEFENGMAVECIVRWVSNTDKHVGSTYGLEFTEALDFQQIKEI